MKVPQTIVPILLSVFLAACVPAIDTQSLIETGIAQTAQISQLETAAAGNGGQALAAFDWTGEWTMWTDIQFGPLYLTQSGNMIEGYYVYDGRTTRIKATLIANNQIAVWQEINAASGETIAYIWQIVGDNNDQFVGNWNGNAYCGARNGAAKPDPCFGP